MSTVKIREAVEADYKLIYSLVLELAEYEKLRHEVMATEEDYRQNLFGEKHVANCLIAELDGTPVGYAIYFYNFSTFLGKPGIYLEDLYVKPDCRGKGIGKKLLTSIASLAVEKKCGRVEWAVLDWNTPAIEFYKSVGAMPMKDWIINRLTGQALIDFAAQD